MARGTIHMHEAGGWAFAMVNSETDPNMGVWTSIIRPVPSTGESEVIDSEPADFFDNITCPTFKDALDILEARYYSQLEFVRGFDGAPTHPVPGGMR